MKKILLLFSLSAMLLVAKAQVTTIADLYGTYKFTATMTVTDAGKSYESNFAAESEVVIKKDFIYDAAITGIAGGKGGAIKINQVNYEKKKIGTLNANASFVNHWQNAHIGITTPDGAYCWGGNNYQFVIYYDDNGNLTMDDFALVLGDNDNATTTILAQFKNCKMELQKAEEVVIDDMSGNWHFKASNNMYDPEATFSAEWDMTITATSEDFKNYKVDFAFDGYDTFTLDATFDGLEMSVPFSETYIDSDAKILILSYMQQRSGTMKFKKGTTASTMSFTSGLRIAQEAEGGATTELQWVAGGTAIKQEIVEGVDFAGTYSVTVGQFQAISDVKYPQSFTIEIVYNEADKNYRVTKFFGEDVTALNNGGIVANVSAKDPSVLEISVGENSVLKELSDNSKIYLSDNQGLTTGKVTLTIDGEGNPSLSDFTTYKDGSIDAMFMGNLVAKGETVIIKPIDYTKTYTLTFDAKKIAVKDLQYGVTFPSDWQLEFMDLSYLEYPVYLSTFLGNNIYNMNHSGATPITVDENDPRTFTIKMTNNNGQPLRVMEVVAQETYIVLRDKEGGENPVSITIDENGNATVSDFSLYAYDVASGEMTGLVAIYGEDAETGISSVDGNATVSARGGIITISGEPVAVEVYNVAGVRVFNGVTNEVAGLVRGIYLVKVGNNVTRILL